MVLVLGLLEESRDLAQWQVAPPGHGREITSDDAGGLWKWIEGRDGVFKREVSLRGSDSVGWCQLLKGVRKGFTRWITPLIYQVFLLVIGFPGGSVVKNLPANEGDAS